MSMFWGTRIGMSISAARDAVEAKGEARRAKTSVDELEACLDSALLACEAMWTLVRDKLDLSDEDLVRRINDLDLSDGRLDGKVRKSPVTCPKCNRTLSRKLPRCMYCGQVIVHDPFG